jgi:hypothetical protein
LSSSKQSGILSDGPAETSGHCRFGPAENLALQKSLSQAAYFEFATKLFLDLLR